MSAKIDDIPDRDRARDQVDCEERARETRDRIMRAEVRGRRWVCGRRVVLKFGITGRELFLTDKA